MPYSHLDNQPRLVIRYEYITPGRNAIVGEHIIAMPAYDGNPVHSGAAAMRLMSAFNMVEHVMRMPHSRQDFIDHEYTPPKA